MFQKFGKDIPQSLVDMVSGIMSEAKADEPAAPDADAIARRKRLQAIKDKQEDDAAERGTGEKKSSGVRQVAGKAYGGAKQKDDKEEMDEAKKCMEADVEESGLRMAAHSAHKAGQKHFEFQGKTYPVKVSKSEETEFKKNAVPSNKPSYKVKAYEDGSCVTKPEAKKIAHTEVGKHEKSMHKEEIQIDEKAKSIAQQKFMGMVYKAKKGGKAASAEVAKVAGGMSKKAAHDFAATKHKGLPQHKEEIQLEATDADLPFTPDKPHGKIAIAGKKGYGVSAAHHLARMGLKKILDKQKQTKQETVMGKAGCTSEETVEESRGHKILATKLKQLSMQSHGMAPELSATGQDIKDKLKDADSLKQVEIVRQKDSSIKKEEVEQVDETAALDQYIKSMGYDPEHMEKNKKVMFSKTNAFKTWAQTKQEALYDAGQKGTQDIDTHMSPGATARG